MTNRPPGDSPDLTQLAQLEAELPSRFVAAALRDQGVEWAELLAVACSDDQRVLIGRVNTDSPPQVLATRGFALNVAPTPSSQKM
jgi:hypothetical protein